MGAGVAGSLLYLASLCAVDMAPVLASLEWARVIQAACSSARTHSSAGGHRAQRADHPRHPGQVCAEGALRQGGRAAARLPQHQVPRLHGGHRPQLRVPLHAQGQEVRRAHRSVAAKPCNVLRGSIFLGPAAPHRHCGKSTGAAACVGPWDSGCTGCCMRGVLVNLIALTGTLQG